MDKEMKDLYNSMSPEEKQKYQREMQKQFNETGKQVGNALKNEVHKIKLKISFHILINFIIESMYRNKSTRNSPIVPSRNSKGFTWA